MSKTRATNNRTITVAEDEKPLLRSFITLPDQINGTELQDTIINTDLFDVIDLVPNEVADLIIIDPPYNLTKDFNGNTFSARSSDDYESYLRTWFPKVCGKLKPTGSLYLCGDWKCTAALQKVMSEHLTILNRITWQREKGRGAKANWKNSMEDIWFGVKDPHAYYFNVEAVKLKRRVIAPYRVDGKPKDWDESTDGNFRLTYPSNFWDDISIPFWSMPENTDHPTQKPEKLYAKLILASSKPGDVIFDPFMGSGTAAVTAKKLGRHYLGVELNEEYCLWAAKRLQMAESDSAIQGYSDGVFWERNTLAQQKIK
ncbi:MAG: site-specific DNA-methyltransferase [Paludibacteraceae bacterium]|nr:site-specific DNA-methyltransferase [Paludibacteraceae bacterium]